MDQLDSLFYDGSQDLDGVHSRFEFADCLEDYGHKNTLYNLLDQTQVISSWPEEHPLPLPKWNSKVQKAYKLEDFESYQRLCWDVEVKLQKLLEDLNYDSVNNLLMFYRAYKKWGRGDFVTFFRR